MNKNSTIFVAGHRGMVGSAIVRKLRAEGYTTIVTRTKDELDLTDALAVQAFFKNTKPEYVFLAAAKVGGIIANRDYPADFLYQNLQIQNTIIHQSYLSGVKKLLFLGSSCIYPKHCPQPMQEVHLLTDTLEPTNEPYAIAKIAGIKMCQSYNMQYGTNFIACMPTNLYGPNDNYDLQTSHVLPAMIRKFHEAKSEGKDSVTLWGDGSPLREFLHVDDMANACLHLMQTYTPTAIDNESGSIFFNIGTGKDITILQLAKTIQAIIGYDGEIIWDTTKPNGTPRKLLDVKRMSDKGWEFSIELEDGIKNTYKSYLHI